MTKYANLNLTIEKMQLLLSLVEEYPRNMREPFETNGDFENYLQKVDCIKSAIESAIYRAEIE